VHPAKALGLNDMPFDGDTRVTQSNVAGAPIFHAKKIFGRNFRVRADGVSKQAELGLRLRLDGQLQGVRRLSQVPAHS